MARSSELKEINIAIFMIHFYFLDEYQLKKSVEKKDSFFSSIIIVM